MTIACKLIASLAMGLLTDSHFVVNSRAQRFMVEPLIPPLLQRNIRRRSARRRTNREELCWHAASGLGRGISCKSWWPWWPSGSVWGGFWHVLILRRTSSIGRCPRPVGTLIDPFVEVRKPTAGLNTKLLYYPNSYLEAITIHNLEALWDLQSPECTTNPNIHLWGCCNQDLTT